MLFTPTLVLKSFFVVVLICPPGRQAMNEDVDDDDDDGVCGFKAHFFSMPRIS